MYIDCFKQWSVSVTSLLRMATPSLPVQLCVYVLCVCVCEVIKNIADKFSDITWQLKFFMNYIFTNFKNGNINLLDIYNKNSKFHVEKIYINLFK